MQYVKKKYKVSTKYNMLNVQTKLLLTFMKLKLALSYNALAAIFVIGRSTAGDIFKTVVSRLGPVLKEAIVWLRKIASRKICPSVFRIIRTQG